MTRLSKQERGALAYDRGLWAERIACWLLQAKFYRIVGKRVKTHGGEVDIVARKGKSLIIVEVKARQTLQGAAEAVSSKQWARLLRAGEILLAREPEGTSLRFDVVQLAPGRWPRHIKDAWRP
ncbi:YraN family protein [Parvibaculaceae bacterium PLY_AMNH_Bact1]|nr:YraN family protein [Parvibaculaceae bacterium PLY_AMNH_Bact1]